MASEDKPVSVHTVDTLVTSISQEVVARSQGDLLTQEMISNKVAENIEASAANLEQYFDFITEHNQDIESIKKVTEAVRSVLSRNYTELNETLQSSIAINNERFTKLSKDVGRYLTILSDITADSKQITADNGELRAGAWTILSQARKWDLDILKKIDKTTIDIKAEVKEELESFLEGQTPSEEIISKMIEELGNTPLMQEIDKQLKENIEVQLDLNRKLVDEAKERSKEIRNSVNQVVDESGERVREVQQYVNELKEELYSDYLGLKENTDENFTIIRESITNILELTAPDLSEYAKVAALEALTVRMASSENSIDALSSSITDLSTSIENKADSGALSALTNRVTLTEDKVNTQSSSITALQNSVAGKADISAVTDLTSRVVTSEKSVEAQGVQITNLNATVKDKADSSALTTLDNRVKTTESSIVSQGNQITSLNNSLSDKASTQALQGLTTTVSELNGRVTSEAAKITELASNAGASSDNMIVNAGFLIKGRNPLSAGILVDLAKESNVLSGASGNATKISVEASVNAYPSPFIAPAFLLETYPETRSISTKVGDVFTLEFEVYSTVARNIRATFDLLDSTSATNATLIGTAPLGMQNHITVAAHTWQKLAGSVVIPEGIYSVRGNCRIDSNAAVGVVYIRAVKFYKEANKDIAQANAISSLTARTTELESVSTSTTSVVAELTAHKLTGGNLVRPSNFEPGYYDGSGLLAGGSTVVDRRDLTYIPIAGASKVCITKVDPSGATTGTSMRIVFYNAAKGVQSVVTALASSNEAGYKATIAIPATAVYMRYGALNETDRIKIEFDTHTPWSAADELDWTGGIKSKGTADATTSLTARTTAVEGKVTSQANTLTTLTSSVNSVSNSLTVQGKVVDGLKANYVVKMNTNGTIASFGMIQETGVYGNVVSAFGVIADNFYIGSPSSNKKPFLVTTATTTVNGVSYPAGTWIDVAFIANATIGTAKIADLAVTAAKIANATITNAEIANATITNAKLADLTVTNAKIANATITEGKIANLAVTNAKIANAAITNAKIGNLAVDSLKIADNAVTIPSTSYLASEVVVNSTAWTDVASLFVASSEGSALIMFNTTYNVDNNGGVDVYCRILRGSTVVRGEFQIIAAGLVGGNSIRPSGSASTNYLETGKTDATIKVQFRLASGPAVVLTHRSLTALVVKK